MKVALYLRVSTEEQTTSNQEVELKKYCEREKYEIYKIYKDEAEQKLIFSKEGVRTSAITSTSLLHPEQSIVMELDKEKRIVLKKSSRKESSNINLFLTIFDSCYRFTAEIDSEPVSMNNNNILLMDEKNNFPKPLEEAPIKLESNSKPTGELI